MRALGARTTTETTCYLTGGASAVLGGWRETTIDVDVLFAPENDELLRAIPDAQALAKLERGHDRDLSDVAAMLSLELVDPRRLRAHFAEVEPHLYRFPAVDPSAFRSAVEQATDGMPWGANPEQ